MQVDYIVVGQGLSGSWISWFLMQQKKSFVVIDKNEMQTASKNSAGIMNPMTGKRYAKVPLLESIFPFAVNAYQEVGIFFNQQFIYPTAIINFFSSKESEDLFLKRKEEEPTYLSNEVKTYYQNEFNIEHAVGRVNACFRVDVHLFLNTIQTYLKSQNQFLEEAFEYDEIEIVEDKIIYKKLESKHLVFCDGTSVANNPFWNQLPFANTKGEVLLVEIKNLSADFIYKNKHMMVPLKENLFWVGASNSWQFETEKPTQEFYLETKKWLDDFLKIPYKIIEHKASIRPTAANRNIVSTWHTTHKNIGILNGMGTKGSSHAPYYAAQLVSQWL
jgi:glycine/D-amino acid oxidase-like deaminating enzyme